MLEHDGVLIDRPDIIRFSEPMSGGTHLLGDHDPVEDILVLGCQDVRDRPDLLPIRAADRSPRCKHPIADRLPGVHAASI